MRVREHGHDLGILGLPGDVSPWDIRFDPRDVRYLERLESGELRFKVWTEPDIEEAWLVVRPDSGPVVAYEMGETSRSGRFAFWSTDVALPEPAEYSFAFRSVDGRPVYLVASGVSNAVERLDRFRVDPAGVHRVETPAWVRGAVIYQIFPDRFANGDPDLDPAGTAQWGSPPHARVFQGGDLPGVTGRLDYLAGLGVDVIYLNPVFTSPSTHRYDTTDYFRVEPSLGGNRALSELVERAHDRSIRVILDASFNHVHPTFFAFADLMKCGPRSEYADWFVVDSWPLRLIHRPAELRSRPWVREWLDVWANEVGLPVERVEGRGRVVEPTYEAWYSVPTMPRVRLSNPDARSYFLGVAAHWIREYGIDGWRMDVARYVDPDFWNDFRDVVKEANPDAYLLSEIMGDTGPWLQGDRFDATMNYTFRSICLRFFAWGEIDGSGLVDEATRLIAQYPWSVTLANQNLLGSHDTPRFLTEARSEMWRLVLATVFQLTFPGAPGIYYGDEVGVEGGDDPGCRAAFPWHAEDHDLRDLIAAITAIRRRRRSLVTGRFTSIEARRDLVVFERREGRERTVVAINRGNRPAAFSGYRLKPRWGAASIADGVVTVPGRQAAILW
ncbi:MAG: glycoside hydrolase family 13 protein [Acidimicrobiia bacterium]|nr:glycoside hydrolase family 13 protein [Acidimicrobiia bacterium]